MFLAGSKSDRCTPFSSLTFSNVGKMRGPWRLPESPLRGRVAPLLSVDDYGRGRMTYDLRGLRLRGLIEKIPLTRRHHVTDDGLRTALCYHRTYARVLRPAMSVVFDAPPRSASRLNRAVDSFDSEVQRLWAGRQLAA